MALEQKKYNLCSPSMPSESLSVRLSGINSAPMALTGAQVVILYFFSDKNQLHRPIHMLYDSSNDYHSRISIVLFRVSSIGSYRINRIRNDYNVEAAIMNKGSISVVFNSNK